MKQFSLYISIALIFSFLVAYILYQKNQLLSLNFQADLLAATAKAQNVGLKNLSEQYKNTQALITRERTLAKERASILQKAEIQDLVQGVINDETSKNVVNHINSILYAY